MVCPKCGGNTKVVDSRAEVDCVNRKRQCTDCSYRFLTIEIDEDIYKKVVCDWIRGLPYTDKCISVSEV